MATVFLIRHGLTAQTGQILYGRTRGIPLDDLGRAQADELVRRFADVKLTALYSSPLERCVQTIEPLARTQRLKIVEREALIEMDSGSWTGRSLAQLRRTKLWSSVQAHPSTFAFPDEGESFRDAEARAIREVERIARRHRRGRVGVATHGDIVRMIVAHYMGLSLDDFQRVVADTASVTVLGLDGRGNGRALLVNDTGGLSRFGKAHSTPPPSGRAKVRG